MKTENLEVPLDSNSYAQFAANDHLIVLHAALTERRHSRSR